MLFIQLILVGFTLYYVFVSKHLVDLAVSFFQNEYNNISINETTGFSPLIKYGIIFTLLSLLRPILSSIKSYFSVKVSIRIANNIRYGLFEDLMYIQNEYSKKYHSGDMLNRLQSDVSQVAGTIAISLPNLIGACMQFAAAFLYLLHLESRLAWILLVVVPGGIVAGKYVMKRVRELSHAIKKSDSEVQSHIQESFQNLTLLQTLEYRDNSEELLSELQEDNYSKNMKRNRFSVLSRSLVSLSFSGGFVVAFLWGIFGLAKGSVTYGLMIAFVQLVGQVQRPLLQMSDQLPTLLNSTASIDRLLEIASLPKENASQKKFLSGVSGVRFENVSFSYSDSDVLVFSDFSWDFRPGTRTAVVGPTGVGKSTMIRLMLALLSPNSGKVYIYDDKEKIQASSSTRCNLVYVPQGNSLFSGTIRENLLMGNPDATENELTEVLKCAAADFVFDLPDGLDTQCFEQGAGLSEGQAQRIAIARALLRPGSILLLDEFSSALDTATELKLLERLTSKLSSHTMIFITHREKIIDYCDSQLVLSVKNG